MNKLLWISLAGALGSLARFGLGGLVQRWTGEGFPWGTLVVNSLGCFVFGAIWSLAEEKLLIGSELKTIILVGFLGAFTTLSSFAFETGQMIQNQQWVLAGGNLLTQNALGILLFFLGVVLGRSILPV